MSDQRPTSVKEQAARMILGEISPLVEKLDAAAATLTETHEHLQADVTHLAAIVTTAERSAVTAQEHFEYLIGQARQVQTVIARFESSPARQQPGRAASPWLIAGIAGGAAVLAAALAVGIVVVLERHTLDQARVGRAVMQAYPQLDSATRQKLDAAIQKAGA